MSQYTYISNHKCHIRTFVLGFSVQSATGPTIISQQRSSDQRHFKGDDLKHHRKTAYNKAPGEFSLNSITMLGLARK